MPTTVSSEEEEMLEHFDDFTIASSWERFISEIEEVCRIWMADGPKRLLEKGAVLLGYSKNSYKVKSELKYAMKSYCIEYYFESNNKGKPVDWRSAFHDLQLCFGVKEFLVISPQSASSVVLDAPEASKLLSAVAIALSNCSSLWPAFVPVHDPSRKAYIGIQNMGTVFTRRFEADGIGSQVPIRLMHLEGLYELFVSKFAYSTLGLSTHLFKVQFEMKLTYRMLPYDDDNIKDIDAQNTKSGENLPSETSSETLWDTDCPWSEWYSVEDPIKGFELITIWSERMVESSMEMDELENASPYEAEKWLISPSCAPKLFEETKWNHIGFASRLLRLVDALKMSFEAKFMESFISGENSGSKNLKSSMIIPPPSVRDQVLKQIFQEGVQLTDPAYGGHKTSQAVKGAPLESLFAQFCLHSLWFGDCNIRAIAVLWIEFVQEVRRCWEESQLIPRTPANGSIDLSTCLINQKLQMLASCIENKCEMKENYQDCIGSEDHIESVTEVLHYLESLQPHQLLEQMVCTAFKAAADTLIQTSYGELKQMETMMQKLYLTMAPALMPLQVNRLSADNETIEDLRRLCVVFQHIEKLVALAASLCRKFLQAPRLAREIFSDFYNFYIPRMGIGLTEDALVKKFDKKQEVWNKEREAVSNMLVQPNANQSWRKVLSMGNLLNGHEPILREVIFSLHDGVNGNQYATHTTSVSQQNIETYRMYVRGTCNDLRVALSALSCD